jgi:hypothetical protein
MRKCAGLFLLLCVLITLGFAQEFKSSFDETRAWEYIKAMAADSMQGRKSGQPGGTMGEDYIASMFKQWGVEPAGDDFRNVMSGIVLSLLDRAGQDN